MKTDIEIAQEAKLADIREIAKRLGLSEDDISLYGKYKAKIPAQNQPKAKMILVTAINPTSAGEGKTTVSIGLADGLRRIGKNVCLALREPSLGPVFGIKGGAAGGGYAQVLPMEDINLHFTGDLHAITAANNLICAVVDNHLYFGNELGLKEIYFKRCMDMNDRSLRDIVIGRNRQGVERETGFDITAASEIMAILCLATDMEDLKKRIGNIIIGINEKGEYELAEYNRVEGAANGNEDLTAYTMTRNGKSYAVIWHTKGQGELTLPLDADTLTYEAELGGEKLPLIKDGNSTKLSVSDRAYLSADMSEAELAEAIKNSVLA